MHGLYFLLGLMGFWLVVIALSAALEKRLVWPFVPAADLPPDRVPPASEYAHAAARAATQAGFTWLGTFGDGKGKLYRIRYDVFRAPQGDVLAFVGVGTVASMPVQNTWLNTLLSDGRRLMTIDNQAGGELDLTGFTEECLVRLAPFDELLAAHRARIDASGRPIEPFSAADPLGDLRRFRQGHVERMERMGYAVFADREHATWRYSPKGSMMLAVRQYFNGLRRRIVPDAVPRPARH